MVSFISKLSLLLLVLANGYFAAPVVDQFVSTTPFSALYLNSTTDRAVGSQLAFNAQTTGTPMMESSQPREENTSRASRISGKVFPTAPTAFTTEESSTYSNDFTGPLFTTVKPLRQRVQNSSPNVESEEGKGTSADISLPSTTNTMSSSVSTSTLTSPINTSGTSTEKYTGLLTDDQVPARKTNYQRPRKPLKTLRRPQYQPQDTSNEVGNIQPTPKSTFQTDVGTKDSSIPIAYLDQQPLSKLPPLLNGAMVLDESNGPAVTAVPKTFAKMNTADKKERKPLNQGQESSQSEEEKSNN